jgi:hypothetical protein
MTAALNKTLAAKKGRRAAKLGKKRITRPVDRVSAGAISVCPRIGRNRQLVVSGILRQIPD